MPRSKEISEDVRKKVVEAHQAGKGYKLISKALGLSKTTIRAILCKWKRFGTVGNLPRSGRPPKICQRTRREIICAVMKNPGLTSKGLQATLASANIHVHHSTIRRILRVHRKPTLKETIVIGTSTQEDKGIQGASEKLSDSSDEFSRDVKVEDLSESDSVYDHIDSDARTMEEDRPVGQDRASCHGADGDEDYEKPIDSGDDSDSDWRYSELQH